MIEERVWNLLEQINKSKTPVLRCPPHTQTHPHDTQLTQCWSASEKPGCSADHNAVKTHGNKVQVRSRVHVAPRKQKKKSPQCSRPISLVWPKIKNIQIKPEESSYTTLCKHSMLTVGITDTHTREQIVDIRSDAVRTLMRHYDGRSLMSSYGQVQSQDTSDEKKKKRKQSLVSPTDGLNWRRRWTWGHNIKNI